jgi:hypothetical protein
MNDFDALRQAFEDLSGQPPLVLGRKEAVMNRVSRRLQRQAVVRGASAFALAAFLGLGAVGTTLHLTQTGSDGPGSTDVVQTEPTHGSTEPTHPSTVEPTRSTSVEPTHAAGVEPTHSTSAEPTHATTVEPTHGTTVEPTHAPVVEPTDAAPSPENTEASGPLTVSVEMSPATVDTSTDTRALVTARDGEGRLLAVDIDWGDGKTLHFAPTGTASCPRTTHLNGSFNHRYASPGSYPVHVTVTSGDCAETEKVTREAHVTVTGSEPTSSPTSSATHTNGPSQPAAGANDRNGDNAANVYLNATGSDADGFVRRIAVDWGDGSTDSVSEWSTSSCTNASGSDHPGPTHHDANVSHHYAEAGAHTVTITVTSVACEGSHSQTGTSTRSVTAP